MMGATVALLCVSVAVEAAAVKTAQAARATCASASLSLPPGTCTTSALMKEPRHA